ncbi:hypothetical protein HHI36_016296 [Cryptolaemus montrouzieri]|uniref:cyclic pyranopterin monophosphate synthase n=1 Tax=Cryptolaemus montrouzieri TaxID=559131 RepID=A0ABD2NJQ6_9CUCU
MIRSCFNNHNINTYLVPHIHSAKIETTFNKCFKRMYSSSKSKNLTHIDEQGKASMVDVSTKNVTSRTATAKGSVYVGASITKLIKENNIKKGDVLGVAKLAGIMAAKKTSELVPLCHNISLNNIKVDTSLDEEKNIVFIEATVSCDGKTGVEMEALTAVSIAALTIYDMCKAVNKKMIIKDIYLVRKTGGSSGIHDFEI